MNPFLTCSPLPHPLHRSAIRSPHRQSHCRPIWAIYAVLKPSRLDGVEVDRINADLTASVADLTTALPLPENAGIAFSGTVKGGKFDIPGDLARRWLAEPPNANGRSNAD